MIYDKKYLIKCLVRLVLVMLLMKFTGGSGFFLVIPFALGALMVGNAVELFFWLLLTVAMVVGNAYLMPKNMIFALSQRFLMMVLGSIMMMRIFGGRKPGAVKPFFLIFPYLGFMAFSSAFGWSPIISYLKLTLFLFIYSAYLGIAKQAGEAHGFVTAKIRAAVLAFAIFFIVGSVLLIPFPSISQLQYEEYQAAVERGASMTSLFKGMTMHSQSMAPMTAGFTILLLADLFFGVKRFDKLYCFLLCCCPILIFKTSSRTGMGTMVIGVMYIIYILLQAKGIGSGWKRRCLNTMLTVVCLASFAFMFSGSGRSGVSKFLLKGKEDSEVSVSDVISSREGLMASCFDNFKDSPLIGNGFQVNLETNLVKRDSILSYLSAPVEKGVWVTAVLEEGGVIGFSLFLIFIFGCLSGLVKSRAYIASSCTVMIILTNFGEFTFFSMSYTGGILWAIVFAAVALDVNRGRSETRGPVGYGQPWPPYYQNGRY